jgi:hypothetical protein
MVVGLAAGVHYYAVVFHRAAIGAAPRANWRVYAVYVACFAIVCTYARREEEEGLPPGHRPRASRVDIITHRGGRLRGISGGAAAVVALHAHRIGAAHGPVPTARCCWCRRTSPSTSRRSRSPRPSGWSRCALSTWPPPLPTPGRKPRSHSASWPTLCSRWWTSLPSSRAPPPESRLEGG